MLRHFQFSLPSVHKSGKSIIYTITCRKNFTGLKGFVT
uniref:Uncharacterized protein n=1 Tax=Anguilla anguilla TaxID=7936 RepID=A0A0E9T2W5_ANGAN